jgi:hypothetical protein
MENHPYSDGFPAVIPTLNWTDGYPFTRHPLEEGLEPAFPLPVLEQIERQREGIRHRSLSGW